MKTSSKKISEEKSELRHTIKLLVRTRQDFQKMRIRIDNRLGIKADGKKQKVDDRAFLFETLEFFADNLKIIAEQEEIWERRLIKDLKKCPIYTEYLINVKGVGPIMAGWMIAEYDIEKATTVSKMWQFTGLNPGLVRGKKRIEKSKKAFTYVITDMLVRGDKKTKGFVCPFNTDLRVVMVGILADGFIMAKSPYALDYYYPYKVRLEQEDSVIEGGKGEKWSEVSKGHRDRAAKRYMIKMFLKDLYVAWRTLEGLPVRKPYAEEYLEQKHATA